MGSAATISATIPSAYLAVPGSEKAPGLFVILLFHLQLKDVFFKKIRV